MAEQQIFTATLDNQMVLLGEPMDWVESAAFYLLLPAGCRHDPVGREGLSNLVCDMVQRGAGERDTRQLLLDLELMGVDYGGSSSNAHIGFGAACLSERLLNALEIFADIIQRPHLPADQLQESQLVCHQELRSIEDDLARRVMTDLRRRHYPEPLGRDQHGTHESIDAIEAADVERFWRHQFVPPGTILGVAGKFDWEEVRAGVEQFFGDWQGPAPGAVDFSAPQRGYRHIEHDSSQTHLAIAYCAIPADHPDFYRAWAAVSILGDGGSSRLFTEVREKRGLAYSCGTSYHAAEREASVQCYAGTTTERAQQTMDVILGEIQGITKGVHEEEVERLKSRCKTTLVMQQESSRARSGSIAHHWHQLGRVRSLQETEAAIDALTCESIGEYLRENPPAEFTISTIGKDRLETSIELS